MKLLIVTVVEDYQDDVIQLFKDVKIKDFSESDIDGYKNSTSLLMTSSWFPSKKGTADSRFFFSFTEEAKFDSAFKLIKEFNERLVTYNPIKAIVIPIEKHIKLLIMKNRIVRGVAGKLILVSLLLAIYVNINWLWFTTFVGVNLLQPSITKWCLMDTILEKVFKVKD